MALGEYLDQYRHLYYNRQFESLIVLLSLSPCLHILAICICLSDVEWSWPIEPSYEVNHSNSTQYEGNREQKSLWTLIPHPLTKDKCYKVPQKSWNHMQPPFPNRSLQCATMAPAATPKHPTVPCFQTNRNNRWSQFTASSYWQPWQVTPPSPS